MSQPNNYKYRTADILKHRNENVYIMVTGFGNTNYDYYICTSLSGTIGGGEMPAHLVDMYWNRVA